VNIDITYTITIVVEDRGEDLSLEEARKQADIALVGQGYSLDRVYCTGKDREDFDRVTVTYEV
jgi:hypothetical protein